MSAKRANAGDNSRWAPDDRREQLLRAGLRLFATKGLAATRAGDIAAACGISQGLLYHYFRSKEELFTELIRGAFERMNEAVRMLDELPQSPAEKIELAMRELVRGFQESEDAAHYFLLIANATSSDAVPKKAREIIRKENKTAYEVLERIMAAGQEEGTIRRYPPAELGLLFWVIVKGLAMHRAAHGKAFRPPQLELLTSPFLSRRVEP